MALSRFRTFLHGLSRPAAPDSDRDLLRRFAECRDEAAFGTLVSRYGGLVYGVCRRVLRNDSDAEDAFQATFLVLARKAERLAGRDHPVGGWLYRTATHIALVARTAELNRLARERRAAMSPNEFHELPDDAWDDVWPVLDEAVQELPDKYGRPVTLCYLLGYTHSQAAAELGLPVGSVSRQLARGLELLRNRLAGRGLTLSVAALTGLLTQTQAGAAPTAIVERTTRLAVLDALGAGNASVPGPVATLVRTATGGHRVAWVAIIGVVAVLAVGAAFANWPVPKPAMQPVALPPLRYIQPAETIVVGRVVDADGKPVAKADVAAFVRPQTKPGEIPEADRAINSTRSNDEGKFEFRLPADFRDKLRLLVSSPKKGFAFVTVVVPTNKEVTVQLSKPQAVEGVAIDALGQPVAGARVRAWWVGDVRGEPCQDVDRDPTPPVPFWPAPVVSDAEGRFSFPALGGTGGAIFEVVHPKFARVDIPWRPRAGQAEESLTARLRQPKEVTGRVVSQKTGKPVAGARIAFLTRVFAGEPPSWTCVVQQSDADGKFRLLPHRTEFLDVIVYPPADSGLAPHYDTLDLDGVERITTEVKLKPATDRK